MATKTFSWKYLIRYGVPIALKPLIQVAKKFAWAFFGKQNVCFGVILACFQVFFQKFAPKGPGMGIKHLGNVSETSSKQSGVFRNNNLDWKSDFRQVWAKNSYISICNLFLHHIRCILQNRNFEKFLAISNSKCS